MDFFVSEVLQQIDMESLEFKNGGRVVNRIWFSFLIHLSIGN